MIAGIDLWILSCLALAATIAFLHSRAGLAITVVLGFVQDPLRKAIAGEPLVVTLLAGIFLGVTILGMLVRRQTLEVGSILRWKRSLTAPALLFLAFVGLQACRTLLSTGSLTLAGIGVLAYGAPIPAFLIGYHLSKGDRDVTRIMRLYVSFTVLMLVGVWLSVVGFDWTILGAVGPGLHAYSPGGGILDLHPGFFRGSEIAGWHGAAASCFVLILLIVACRPHSVLSSTLLLFILGAVVLTGRRKFLVAVAIFTALYVVVVAFRSRGAARLVPVALVSLLAVAFGWSLFVSSGLFDAFMPYYVRGLTLSEQAPGRLYGLTLEASRWIILRNGVFGAGAGMGSQGAQYFGGGSVIVGSAAEGGVGKVLAELGIPGVALLIWVIVVFFYHSAKGIGYLGLTDDRRARLAAGLLCFLAANLMVFLVAHQIFGDIFVLVVLGWTAGSVTALHRWQSEAMEDHGWEAPERYVHEPAEAPIPVDDRFGQVFGG